MINPASIALVVTVKNEADILRFNLQYHAYVGVRRNYVFLDHSTDNTLGSVADLPNVMVRSSVTLSELDNASQQNPDLRYILAEINTHHCARQMLNAWWAARDARQHGCDWLLSLDADELICTHLNEQPAGTLQLMLGQLPTAVDVVRFLPLEVAQSQLTYATNVFAEETCFQTIYRSDGSIFELVDQPLQRQVLDPATREVRPVSGYLGHIVGKVAVRLSHDPVPASVHGFNAAGHMPLNEVRAGWLLHYNMFSFERFVAKYQAFSAHPDYFVTGAPVPWTLKAWRDLVNSPGISPRELQEYYQRWIVLKKNEIVTARSMNPPRILEVNAVRKIWSRLQPPADAATTSTKA